MLSRGCCQDGYSSAQCVTLTLHAQMLAERLAAVGLVNEAAAGYSKSTQAAAPRRNVRQGGAARQASSDEDSDFE